MHHNLHRFKKNHCSVCVCERLLCVFWHPSLVRSGQRGAEVLDIVALLHKWMQGDTMAR